MVFDHRHQSRESNYNKPVVDLCWSLRSKPTIFRLDSALTLLPAGVWGLQLDDVYLLIDIWTKKHTAYGCLRLDITTQVVQRQELVVNFAGVRKYRV